MVEPGSFLFPYDYPYYSGNSSMMRKVIGIFLSSALMCGPAALAEPLAAMSDASETIQYLLAFVKNSECRFFRNDKEHTAGEAASHMQRKYTHFKDKIQTPEDFIRLTATKSLMTGKLYYVKFKDGRKITSAAWLLQALEDFRQEQN